MKATISFSCYESAKIFARLWALKTFRGYTLSCKDTNGGCTVTLDGVTSKEKEIIETLINSLKT